MTLVQNFPFAAIMMCLAGGVTCAVLKPRTARILALAIGTIPIVVLFAAFSKNLIKGLTVGAVKG